MNLGQQMSRASVRREVGLEEEQELQLPRDLQPLLRENSSESY